MARAQSLGTPSLVADTLRQGLAQCLQRHALFFLLRHVCLLPVLRRDQRGRVIRVEATMDKMHVPTHTIQVPRERWGARRTKELGG
jgi:hypothetical protein